MRLSPLRGSVQFKDRPRLPETEHACMLLTATVTSGTILLARCPSSEGICHREFVTVACERVTSGKTDVGGDPAHKGCQLGADSALVCVLRADSHLVYPGAEALGSANRELAGLKPSAATEPKNTVILEPV